MCPFQKIIFVILLLFLGIKGISQTTDCRDQCNFKFVQNYNHEEQRIDFQKLANSKSIKDSIELIKKILSFDCNSELGKKACLLQQKIIKEKYKVFQGEWKFEWLGSNWGTGKIDSLNFEELLVIQEDKIQINLNGKIQNKDFEILCIGLDYYKNTYLLIKIDSINWQFFIEKDLGRNIYARIDTPDELKSQNKFLYLRQSGLVCGNMEKVFSKKNKN